MQKHTPLSLFTIPAIAISLIFSFTLLGCDQIFGIGKPDPTYHITYLGNGNLTQGRETIE